MHSSAPGQLRVYSAFLAAVLLLTHTALVSGKTITIFDDFCSTDSLYKPYLKYFHGRVDAITKGTPFKVHPPGFWSDIWEESMENTYVCINGPAWLYYKLTTSVTEVYEQPELHIFIHQCIIVNGRKGPGPHEINRELLAILLMGDPNDYRLPAIQLFTAPYQCTLPQVCDPAAPVQLINTTSIMMIGSTTECILNKGKLKTPIRIRTDDLGCATGPCNADNAGTYCRLSYREIADQVKSTPPITDPSATAQAIAALKNDDIIRIQGCYVPDNFTVEKTKAIIDLRVLELDPTKDPSTLDLKVETYFNISIPEADKAFLPSADPAGPYEEADILNEINATQSKIKDPATDKSTIAQLKTDLMTIRLRMYIHNAFKEHENLHTIYEATTTAWTALKTTSDALETTELAALHIAETEKTAAYTEWHLDTKDLTKKQAYDDKVNAYVLAEGTFLAKSNSLAPLIAAGEIMRSRLDMSVKRTKFAFDALIRAYTVTKGGNAPPFVKNFNETAMNDLPTLITIKRDPIPEPPKKDDLKTTCGDLPPPKRTCSKAKPGAKRACQLLQSRMGKFVMDRSLTDLIPPREWTWKPEDSWRQEVLDLIEDIFFAASSQMLKREFPLAINRIMRAYLSDFVQGTLPFKPPPPGAPSPLTPPTVPAPTPQPAPTALPAPPPTPETPETLPAVTRRRRHALPQAPAAPDPAAAAPATPAAADPAAAAPATPAAADPAAAAPATPAAADPATPAAAAPAVAASPPSEPEGPVVDLPTKRPFWEIIVKALRECKRKDTKLYFKVKSNGPREEILFSKSHKNNGTQEDITVEHFVEQADEEFAFNWAIDSNWRIFATVMGLCMPYYETKIPLITAKFYTHYTEDFLIPLAAEWVNNRDNAIFKYILGEYYGGLGDLWTKLFMESSYIASGDVKYRPPRKLMVNGVTEANFFISGPLAGTAGMYTR